MNIDEMFSECYYKPQQSKELISKINVSIRNIKNSISIKKLFTVYFTSGSQKINNFPLSCYNTDIFSVLEEKLINEKPELRHKNIYFLSGGNIINTSKTLEENKIKDEDKILIYENE